MQYSPTDEYTVAASKGGGTLYLEFYSKTQFRFSPFNTLGVEDSIAVLFLKF